MEDTFVIAEKKFKLQPLKGRRARRSVPRIIEIGAAVFKFASESGIDLKELMESPNPSINILASLLYQLSVYLGEQYDTIEQEVFPVLLCAEPEDWVFIDEEATPGELYRALWIAIQYHLNTSFGIEVQQALKNLPEAQEVEPETS